MHAPKVPVVRRDEHRHFVWATLDSESVIPPAADAMRIESLPGLDGLEIDQRCGQGNGELRANNVDVGLAAASAWADFFRRASQQREVADPAHQRQPRARQGTDLIGPPRLRVPVEGTQAGLGHHADPIGRIAADVQDHWGLDLGR